MVHARVQVRSRRTSPTDRNGYGAVAAYVTTLRGSGIVYCLTRRQCEDMAALLVATYGTSAVPYHSALSTHTKHDHQTQWMDGRTRVICATDAFGLGIDKNDCRFVVHLTPPISMQNYFQHIGRAGRDGSDAVCTMWVMRFE